MFKKILVPLDRSYFAEQALAEATALARRANASIRLLLVHQPVPYAGFEDIPWNRDEATIEHEYLATMLKELGSAKIPATSRLERGNPAKIICRHAERSGCDLIVMTSHGRTGLNRMWMGSVADAVIRHSTVPVLMIRPTDHKSPHAKPASEIKRILITLDGSALARSVLPAATDLAGITGAAVTLLTVVQPVPWIPPLTNMPFAFSPVSHDQSVTNELTVAAEQNLANEKVTLEKVLPVVETAVVVASSAPHAIMECIDSRKIDLVAMSTHGRGGSRFLRGSVADKILRASNVPVLLYHPDAKAVDDTLADQQTKAVSAV